MTIEMMRLLAHMAWANQKTITHLRALPDEALKAYVINSEWTVAEMVHHIVDSADHYVYRLSGKLVLAQNPDSPIADVNSNSDLVRIAEQAAKVDAALGECVHLDETQLEFTNSAGKDVKRWRSTILSQAIHHATEHRAQIAAALEFRNFPILDLDELDLWAFEINQG